MNTPLKAQRLYITQFTEKMAGSVHENSLDDDNRRFIPDEVFETVDAAHMAISTLLGFYSKNDSPLVYAVVLNDGQQIGHVQAAPIEQGWEIGYHIGRDYTRKGYATEAVHAFLLPIMERLSVSEIFGICRADNTASIRVLEKCGFILDYNGEGNYHGQAHNICRYVFNNSNRSVTDSTVQTG